MDCGVSGHLQSVSSFELFLLFLKKPIYFIDVFFFISHW